MKRIDMRPMAVSLLAVCSLWDAIGLKACGSETFGCVAPVASAPRPQLEIPPSVARAEQTRIEVISTAKAAAIGVFGPGGKGGGSGVLISPAGFALTNFHVVQGNGPFMKCSLPDGILYDAVVVGVDPVGDIALIKLVGRNNFPTATLGDSDQLQQGQWCFSVGNPFLLATDFQPSVSWGIVSGLHRYQYPAGTLLEYADCIQTDAAINPGNSGGPLFNDRGELIGINGRGSFEKRGRVNVGVGYAISINQIKLFLNQLHSGRLVDHATLGATVSTNQEGQIRVGSILETSDAFRRGLRLDDEITFFGHREIHTANQFKNELGIYPKGYRVPLSFVRDGVQHDIRVRLTGVHSAEKLVELIDGSTPIDDLPPDQPGSPIPRPPTEKPTPPTEKLTPTSRSLAKLYEARRGFANYYFNRHHQKRVWEQFVSNGDFSNELRAWQIQGRDQADRPFECVLGTRQSGLRYADETCLIDAQHPLEPPFSKSPFSKVLIALHLYRRLLQLGPEQFGEVTYFGRLPTPDGRQEAEVLTGVFDVSETRFFFDSESGRLIAMEMHADVDEDPVELAFSNFREIAGRSVPSTILIQLGDGTPLRLSNVQLKFVSEGATVD